VANRKVVAQVILLDEKKGFSSWKVRVEYDNDFYLVLITDRHTVVVYLERELPDSPGVTMSWPTHMAGLRSAAIECVRRVRFGETG
jgi:hypothetical protein